MLSFFFDVADDMNNRLVSNMPKSISAPRAETVGMLPSKNTLLICRDKEEDYA